MRTIDDLRYAARSLRRSPGFTLVVLATLTVGIAANAGIFSVLNAILLRPFPGIDPDHWVSVWETPPAGSGADRLTASAANLKSWREQAQSLDGFAAYVRYGVNISDVDMPERVHAMIVTPDSFEQLRVAPQLGRDFEGQDTTAGRHVVILSDAVWHRQYGGDANLIGKTIRLNNIAHEVVGILPPGFNFPPLEVVDVYLPAPPAMIDNPSRAGKSFVPIAHLKPGITMRQAQQEMDVIAARLAATYPDDKGFGVRLVSLREDTVGDIAPQLIALAAAVGFVLLLACVNVANLQLARALSRRRDLALRATLGASPMDLLRQLMAESIVLIAVASVAGVLLAPYIVDSLMLLVPAPLSSQIDVVVDWRVLAIIGAAVALATLLFGLFPAIVACRPGAYQDLRDSTRGATGGRGGKRLRGALAVAEIALALCPLAGAGLMARSLLRLEHSDRGYNPENVLTFAVSLPNASYKESTDVAAFVESTRQSLSSIPGATAVGVARDLPPFSETEWIQMFHIDGAAGQPSQSGDDADNLIRYTLASPNTTKAIGMRVASGRFIDETDTATSAPVVVLNRAAVHALFNDNDPLGRQISLGSREFGSKGLVKRTIIGILENAAYNGPDSPVEPMAIGPFSQLPDAMGPFRTFYFAIRVDHDPLSIVGAARAALARVDRNEAMFDVRPMTDREAEAIWLPRFSAIVLAVLSAAAVLLAALGIYGVMAHAVSSRTGEIGVRMALGARRADIFRDIIRRGLILALLGIALGAAGSLGLTRLLESILYEVSPHDPATFIAVCLLLLVVALVACCIPAARATRVDPVVALREE
jgi:putative ABC transport system permease protein